MKKLQGIQTKIVDATSFVDVSDSYDLLNTESFSTVSDRFRYRLGKFWTNHATEIKKASNGHNKFLFEAMFDEKQKIITLIADKNYFLTKKLSGGVYKTSFLPDMWKNFLIRTDPFAYPTAPVFNIEPFSKELFYDHYFEITKPIEIKENLSNSMGTLKYFDKKFKYQFYSPKYEAGVQPRSVSERILPSIYSILDIVNPSSPVIDKKEFTLLQISLGGQVPSNLYKNIIENQTVADRRNLYHESFGGLISQPETRAVLDAESSAGGMINLSNYSLKSVKGIAEKLIPSPYYFKLSFLVDEAGYFLNSLIDTKLFDKLSEDFQETSKGLYPFAVSENKQSLEIASYKIFDFKKWYQDTVNYSIAIGTNAVRDEARLANYISLTQFSKKINLLKSKLRTLEEIYDGKEAYSEVLFYKIEKYWINSKGDPIQEFHVAPDKDSLIEFIDTQIKYDKKYTYKIVACTAVIGNEYNFINYYTNTTTDPELNKDIENGIFRIRYENRPSIKIIEIPYFETVGEVLEQPACAPVVEISNIKNKETTLKLSISKHIDNLPSDLRIIEEKDFNYYQKVLNIQEQTDKIIYRNEDNIAYLEIYKTNVKPKDYVDFSGRLLTTVPTKGDNYTFLDQIFPETDYYYCFRYLTRHGEPSKTSEVYHAILKNNGNYNYLETTQLSLEPQVFTKDERAFKKYVMIKPNIKQLLVSADLDTLEKNVQQNDTAAVSLGITDQKVWGKRFKMRLRSLKTGRTLDFNFSFKRN